MDWQPIETAPLDGTRVLVYIEGYAESTAIAWYSNNWNCWVAVFGSQCPNPTHWKPCPLPPV